MKKRCDRKKKYVLIVVLICVIGLIFYFSFADTGKSDTFEEGHEEHLEAKLSDMVESLDGISSAEVMVTLDSYEDGEGSPRVRGVAVICHGRNKDDVKIKIVMILSTALGIPSDKIFVSFS